MGYKWEVGSGSGRGYNDRGLGATLPETFFSNLTLRSVSFDRLTIALWFPVVTQYVQ